MGGIWDREKKTNWQRNRRKELKEAGMCTAHATVPVVPGHKYCERCLKEKREDTNANRFFVKLETFDHYGKICTCCGEERPEFLTLDHLNNDGGKHRKEGKSGGGICFYAWLKARGYPQDLGLTVRCFNCNCARSAYGICPHEEERKFAKFREGQRESI